MLYISIPYSQYIYIYTNKHSFLFLQKCKDVSIFSTRTGRDQRGAAVEARLFDGGPGQSDALCTV